jgi:hypothetical protein
MVAKGESMVTSFRGILNALLSNAYIHHAVLVCASVVGVLSVFTKTGVSSSVGYGSSAAAVSAVLHSLDGLLPTPTKPTGASGAAPGGPTA